MIPGIVGSENGAVSTPANSKVQAKKDFPFATFETRPIFESLTGTVIKGLSKTDSKQMLSNYGSLKAIIEQVDADPHQFMKLKFFGKNKVQRLRDVFN